MRLVFDRCGRYIKLSLHGSRLGCETSCDVFGVFRLVSVGPEINLSEPAASMIVSAAACGLEQKVGIMSDHLYAIGDNVKLQSSGFHVLGKSDAFVIVSRMPPFGGEFQYRIKSRSEPHERVVTEDRLSPLVLQAAAE